MINKKLKENQEGFTFHAIILGLVVIVAICFVGWRVVSSHSKHSNTSSPSQNMSKATLDHNCTNTKSISLPDDTLTLQAPSCWKVNTYDSESVRIDSSNKYIAPCPLPNTTKGPCYQSDAYVYIDGGEPAAGYGSTQKWQSEGYVLTSFQNEQSFCANPTATQSKTLPRDIPNSIPQGMFVGAGCYVLWNNNYYDIHIGQNSKLTDMKQVYNLLESIKFK